jgi:hypothetical protein
MIVELTDEQANIIICELERTKDRIYDDPSAFDLANDEEIYAYIEYHISSIIKKLEKQ